MDKSKNCIFVTLKNYHDISFDLEPSEDAFPKDFSDDRLEKDVQTIKYLFNDKLVGKYYTSLTDLKNLVFRTFIGMRLNFRWEVNFSEEF